MRKRLLGLWLLTSSLASAQCVMCGRTAAAQNLARQAVLNHGIIALLIPPVGILGFFLSLAYQRRKG